VVSVQNAEPPIDAALVMLVDLPGVGADVVDRVLAAARAGGDVRSAVLRAGYDGRPGHPVLLGRDHWSGASAAVSADRGARDYLSAQAVRLVECADIGNGIDVDRPTGHG
jgi:CTP:molybdopterin cytidylyltransferase MocA